jgi:hypothetical protein
MRILNVKAFEYKELSEEAKEKVLEEQRYINVRFNDWCETILDSWKCILEEFGFCAPRIYFSGFYCQGDGACFDCESIDAGKIFDVIHSEIGTFGKDLREQFDRDKDAIYEYMENCMAFKIEAISSRYCHEKSRKIEWTLYRAPREIEEIEKFVDEIGEWLEEKRRAFCLEIYKQLEEEYEYLTSDKAIEETLDCNEFEFLEDGRLIDFM